MRKLVLRVMIMNASKDVDFLNNVRSLLLSSKCVVSVAVSEKHFIDNIMSRTSGFSLGIILNSAGASPTIRTYGQTKVGLVEHFNDRFDSKTLKAQLKRAW